MSVTTTETFCQQLYEAQLQNQATQGGKKTKGKGKDPNPSYTQTNTTVKKTEKCRCIII